MAQHPWREKKPSEWFGKKEQLEDGSWFAQCLYCNTNPDNEVDGGCIRPPKKEYFPQYYEKHLKKHDAAAAKRQKTAASRSADHGSDSEDSTAEYDLMNEPIASGDTKRLHECLDRLFRGESTFAPKLNCVLAKSQNACATWYQCEFMNANGATFQCWLAVSFAMQFEYIKRGIIEFEDRSKASIEPTDAKPANNPVPTKRSRIPHLDSSTLAPRTERMEVEQPAKETSIEDIVKNLVTVVSGIPLPPPELCCPLTGKLFKDPVITSEGDTYERAAIERYGAHDPYSGVELDGRLIPNKRIRAQAEKWERDTKDCMMNEYMKLP